MNRKAVYVLAITTLVVIGITLAIVLIFSRGKNKFYLEDKYYNNSGLTDTSVKSLEDLVKNKKSFILFVYNDFCSFSIPCDSVFDETSTSLNIQILQIPYRDFKTSKLSSKLKYAPSIMIFEKGKVVDYLDAESDDDYDLYQDVTKFKIWLSNYIYIEKEEK